MVYGSCCLKTAWYSAHCPTAGTRIWSMHELPCAEMARAETSGSASRSRCAFMDISKFQKSSDRSVGSTAGELLHQLADHVLGVTEQHPGPIGKVQFVVDSSESRILAALDRENGLRLVGVDDGHAVDRACLFGSCRRVH